MKEYLKTFLIFVIISACTCGGKTECSNRSKISIIMNFHNPECEEIINNSNSFQETGNHLERKHNYTYEGLNMDAALFDTCGSNTGTLKAIFKTLIWADVNCLRPPFFLGFIGPDNAENLNVAVKVTSALNIPHIIGIPFTSSHTHYLVSASDQIIIQGILKLIEILRWRSFIIETNPNNNQIGNIARQFIKEANAKSLCILSTDDSVPYIIYFGEPDDNFLKNLHNCTVIVVSEENLEKKIRNFDSSNSFLLMDNLRNSGEIYDDNSKHTLTTNSESSELRPINQAIKTYAKAINLICKQRSCLADENFNDWNHVIAQIKDSLSQENENGHTNLFLNLKEKSKYYKALGQINIYRDNVKFYWNEKLLIPGDFDTKKKDFANLRSFLIINETLSTCKKKVNKAEIINAGDTISKHKSNAVIISEMTDSEWWTMVGTVTGVGIAMFTVGFFAVYIVYTNIRGPKSTQTSGKQDLDRDSSLRRIGSDRQNSSNNRNSRVISGLQRRDSRSSIRSNISDKSV